MKGDGLDILVVCKRCGHLVPKTQLCIYCGAPILYKPPRGKG